MCENYQKASWQNTVKVKATKIQRNQKESGLGRADMKIIISANESF